MLRIYESMSIALPPVTPLTTLETARRCERIAMGNKDRQNVGETGEGRRSARALGKYLPASFTELMAAVGTLVVGAGVLYSLVVHHDTHPLCAWLNGTVPGFCGGAASQPEHPLAAQPGSQASASVYLKTSSSDPEVGANLLRILHENGTKLTDNPAQSSVVLEVSADVTVRPGSAVGSTPTWRAAAASSLKAVDAKSQATLLWTTFEGQGTATQADLARRYALDDATKHLAAEYETFAKTSGRRARREETR